MEIEVRTTPTLGDYLRFHRHMSIRDVTMWIYVVMSLIPLLFLLALVLLPAGANAGAPQATQNSVGRRGAIAVLTAIVLIAFVANPLLRVRQLRKQFVRNPEIHEPRTFRFSPETLILTRSGNTTTIPWGDVTRAGLHGDLLVLFPAREPAWIIPLRDIAHDAQSPLLQLIRGHVPRRYGF